MQAEQPRTWAERRTRPERTSNNDTPRDRRSSARARHSASLLVVAVAVPVIPAMGLPMAQVAAQPESGGL